LAHFYVCTDYFEVPVGGACKGCALATAGLCSDGSISLRDLNAVDEDFLEHLADELGTEVSEVAAQIIERLPGAKGHL